VTIASAVPNGAPTVNAEAPPEEQGSVDIAVPPAAHPAIPVEAGSSGGTVVEVAGMAPKANIANVPKAKQARIFMLPPLSASLEYVVSRGREHKPSLPAERCGRHEESGRRALGRLRRDGDLQGRTLDDTLHDPTPLSGQPPSKKSFLTGSSS
jgi:hypothetical protein